MELKTVGEVKSEVNDINLKDGQPSDLRPTPKRCSDGARSESLSTTYRHHWTFEQRLTLTSLAEAYGNDWERVTSDFNHVHNTELRKAVVVAQYHQLRRTRLDTAAPLRKTQTTRRRPSNDSIPDRLSDRHDGSRRKRKFVDSADDHRTDHMPDKSDKESRTTPDMQTVYGLTLLPRTPTKANGLTTPPDSRKRKIPRLTIDKHLANIGFRASTAESQGRFTTALGIRAGAFSNYSEVPLATDLNSTTYEQEAVYAPFHS